MLRSRLLMQSPAVYDYVVCGLGAHGASTLRALSKRDGNKKVLGLEQASRTSQTHGSSHGRSRIIRTGYFEDPAYVPLLIESFALWSELEDETVAHSTVEEKVNREKILELTGGLMIGDPESEVIQGTLTAVSEHNLPHTIMSPEEVRKKYKGMLQLQENEIGIFEEQAGYVVPEAGRDAFIASALRHSNGNTTVQYDRQIDRIEEAIGPDGSVLLSQDEESMPLKRITIRTSNNITAGDNSGGLGGGEEVVYAKQIALALGPWTSQFVHSDKFVLKCSMPLPDLTLQRRALFWIHPKEGERGGVASSTGNSGSNSNSDDSMSDLPIYIWDTPSEGAFYGFPSQHPSEGCKVAFHSYGDHNTPPCGDVVPGNDVSRIEREVSEREVEMVMNILKERVPALAGGVYREGSTCYYTTTKDEHFILDWLPLESITSSGSDGKGEVLLVSCCSGHGYKFSTVLGEAAADLLEKGNSDRDISLFRIDREGL